MYELEIKTKFNTINIVVEDLESEEVKEILEQPYVIEVHKKGFEGDIEKAKVLKKCLK
jgi:hypothetical protein